MGVDQFPHGAAGGTRTHDLLSTNQLLYQLSYGSGCGGCEADSNGLLMGE